MKKTVMLILVGNRDEAATEVQKVLTNYGCLIKTRLGMHGEPKNPCSEKGMIILELIGEESKQQELNAELQKIQCITVKLENLEVKCD